MEKINIFGITADKNFSDYKDFFTESDWSDSEMMYFESNETFQHIDDDFSFNYKFIVEVAERYWENKEDYEVTLSMVILPESCTEKYIESVASCSGIETKDVTWYDVFKYGGASVIFGSTICEKDSIEETILQISHVFKCMNSLFGFYMDKVWNMIGSTGWDIVLHAVLGTDLFGRLKSA